MGLLDPFPLIDQMTQGQWGQIDIWKVNFEKQKEIGSEAATEEKGVSQDALVSGEGLGVDAQQNSSSPSSLPVK